jgi:hypothetical protein
MFIFPINVFSGKVKVTTSLNMGIHSNLTRAQTTAKRIFKAVLESSSGNDNGRRGN